MVLAVFLNNSQAQSNAAPAPPAAAPTAAQPPAPAPLPMIQGRPFTRGRQPAPVFSMAIRDLRMAKMQLQQSTNDFDGHKAAALQACDKAMEELQAVVKASIAAQQKQPPPPGPASGQPAAPPATAPAPVPPAPAPPTQP